MPRAPVQASAEVPFAVLSAKPQLRECFVTCDLPGPGQAVREVALRSKEGATLAVHTVEVPSPSDGAPLGARTVVGRARMRRRRAGGWRRGCQAPETQVVVAGREMRRLWRAGRGRATGLGLAVQEGTALILGGLQIPDRHLTITLDS